MKKTILFIFLLLPFLLYSQKEREIILRPNDNTTTWYLSQIAENVTPIPLSVSTQAIFIYLTDEYIYTCGISSISQFYVSGKYIKTINLDGIVTGITGNNIKKEIYVSTDKNKKVIIYDYSLKEKKIYETKYIPASIFFNKNTLFIHSYDTDESNKVCYYKISTLDLTTGQEVFLAFDSKETYKDIHPVSSGTFSTFNNQVMFSNWVEPVIYCIKENKVSPVIRCNTDIKEKEIRTMPFGKQGFIGKYMFIDYYISDVLSSGYSNLNNYFYLEDTKTGEGYNITYFIYDDIYNTGRCKINVGLNNHEDYFFYVKEKDEVEKADNIIKISSGHVLFLVKTKK